MDAYDPFDLQLFSPEVDRLARRFGRGLDPDERLSQTWCTLLEVLDSYSAVAGCCDFNAYLDFSVQKSLSDLRRDRSRRLHCFSPLPLLSEPDAPGADNLFSSAHTQGGFEDSLAFWDYVSRLPRPMDLLAAGLAQGNTPQELMADLNFSHAEYAYWKNALRQDLERNYFSCM